MKYENGQNGQTWVENRVTVCFYYVKCFIVNLHAEVAWKWHGYSGHGILKLAISQGQVNGINRFFVCRYKSKEA